MINIDSLKVIIEGRGSFRPKEESKLLPDDPTQAQIKQADETPGQDREVKNGSTQSSLGSI